MISTFFTILLILLVVAIGLLTRANRLRRQSGIPPGEIVYEDVSGLARQPLYSRRLSLAGKPDYLLQDPQQNLIPVEVKSGAVPRNGKPYESHLLQLAAYFFLIEDVLQQAAPYGLIRYRNQTIQIANTHELREQLMDVIAQMRILLSSGIPHRNHNQAQRCAHCSVAEVCEERLS